MQKHNRFKNYRWLFVSLAALATVTISTQLTSNSVRADEIDAVNSVENQQNNTAKVKNSAAYVLNIASQTKQNQQVDFKAANNKNDIVSNANNSVQKQIVSQNRTEEPKKQQVINLKVQQNQTEKINISDPDASESAKQLYGYLDSYKHNNKIMFGQQHATDEGLSLTNQEKQPGSTDSDVKKLTGDNPAVIGWDSYLGIMGKEEPGIKGNEQQSIDNLAKSMNAVHDQESIIVLSMHPDNFVTGGNYSDIKGDVVKNILPGGTANGKFTHFLNDLINLSGKLKDQNGKQYAVIFRPFHEQTGSWFWWGAGTTSPAQYKAVFRYTVDYLRDHGVHNFLFAYTPGGNASGDKDRYLKDYPGDNYVDVLGIDSYDTSGTPGTEAWMNGLVKDIDMVVNVAEEKNKIPVLSEYGLHLNQTDNKCKDWYTKVLNHIEADPEARKIAYMFTWRNAGFPDNVYTPYVGFNDQAINQNFRAFAHDSRIVMTKNVGFDKYAEEHTKFVISNKQITVTPLTPTDQETVTQIQMPINIRVDNGKATKVTFIFNNKTYNLKSSNSNRNWITNITIDKKLDRTSQNATIEVYDRKGNLITSQNLELFMKLTPDKNVDPYLIDNYSGYFGNNGVLDRAYATNGDPSTVSLVKRPDGSYGMKYTYSIGGSGYAGRGLSFPNSKDWQGAKGVQLYLKNDSHPGDDFDIQVNIAGITFEAHVDLKQKHDGILYVPFNKFAPASWDTQNKGKVITNDILNKINTFYFYINSKVQGTRSIEVADVRVVKEAPQTTKPQQPTSGNSWSSNNSDQNNLPTHVISNPGNVTKGSQNRNNAPLAQMLVRSVILTHNAYLYNLDGDIVVDRNRNKIIYHKGQTIKVWNEGKVTQIHGKKFYQIAINGYIKVANTITQHKYKLIRLTHNAFIYNKNGKAIRKSNRKRMLLRRKSLIRAWNNGKQISIKGRNYYKIGQNEFVKVKNTVKRLFR